MVGLGGTEVASEQLSLYDYTEEKVSWISAMHWILLTIALKVNEVMWNEVATTVRVKKGAFRCLYTTGRKFEGQHPNRSLLYALR